ncbi:MULTISPECIES: alkyl/aryl-sulfatase [Zhongshania]|jgi:alkyl sulfatase BDS1-like metallo-beta-lactamase superfamily hydrolase|uniref:Linear primary-alkylsulfatase n=1 Tax=Zhongshania antarctica TaxID=641702 RepID=A0A840R2B0_9GAMM|nr:MULTISPECIES: alkyl sulfatase dimerization domain-containing protein [Zhongshania]MBB5187205.1 alkyl sulfatase BDS1-like metallo-beta-lactamase superfamily hydrolase [Zhongshania antarctica]
MPIIAVTKKYMPVLAFSLLAACDRPAPITAADANTDAFGSSAATETTANINRQVLKTLQLTDNADFDDASRGLIARPDALTIEGPNGSIAWQPASYDFIQGDAPASVNPSLWRQAQLNNIHGLFKVTDGVYQVRGFDLANLTLIDGEHGWIVVDPLTNNQTAAAAINFAFEHLPRKPISAILFTHSHIDHFGGVLGALDAGQTDIAKVRVIAPLGFLEEATSENMLAGPTMMRRSDYMYGSTLPRSERGHVDSGLGKGPSYGNISILPPTESIDHTGQTLTIDGVEFVFQNVSGSEAPAEFTFYLPAHKAFCGAELVSRNMHNLYTLRGAKVRDALAWSGFIDEAKNMFSAADVYFASHHWPIWGSQRIASFLEIQRDTYKYIHDQTLRLAYKGYTPSEIAEQIKLPAALQEGFSNRGYYGSLRHNARAVYQRYFGWYDGNPANLDPLPPEQAAQHYVAAMGGAEQVLALAQSAFDSGEYRWTATLLNHLVFAQPANSDAKALLARNYEQLGYQAESAPWRDIYLTGAKELRQGKPKSAAELALGRDMVKFAARSNFFDVMAAQLNAEKAEGMAMTINFHFTDLNENHVLTLKNSVLHHTQAAAVENANATLKISHELFLDLVLGNASLKKLIFSDQLSIEGSKIDLARFFALQDKPQGVFEIVRP